MGLLTRVAVNELANYIATKKVFLWDFDGTLADTERWHYLAVNEAFAKYGHAVTELDYYRYFSFLGLGIPGEIERKKLSMAYEDIALNYRDAYWNIISSGSAKPFAEVPQILSKLKESGRMVAIASNSGEDEIRCILDYHGITKHVDLVVGRLPHLNRKPAPDLFLHALKVVGASPSEAIILEDSEIGLRAASSAGCDALWLRTVYNFDLDTTEPRRATLTHTELLEVVSGI